MLSLTAERWLNIVLPRFLSLKVWISWIFSDIGFRSAATSFCKQTWSTVTGDRQKRSASVHADLSRRTQHLSGAFRRERVFFPLWPYCIFTVWSMKIAWISYLVNAASVGIGKKSSSTVWPLFFFFFPFQIIFIWGYIGEAIFDWEWILFFYLFFKILFYLTLQYCIGFAIYQNESATGIQVFPILNPPPSSLPRPLFWRLLNATQWNWVQIKLYFLMEHIDISSDGMIRIIHT